MKSALMPGMLAILMGAAAPLSAQAPAPAPASSGPSMDAVCPSHDMNIIRTSKIKAGGTLAGFQKAADDNAKWYADHGYTGDKFISARVIDMDKTTGTVTASPDMVMTMHLHATEVPMEKHDAAWAAFVAEYNANTDIVDMKVGCGQ